MATNTITAVQWDGDLDAVKSLLGRSKGAFSGPRAISFNEVADGRLQVTPITGDKVFVDKGQWLTYDLEVFDKLELLKDGGE